MDKVAAEALAGQLMAIHGVVAEGWTLGWSSRWTNTLGRAEFRTRVIRLSYPDVLSDERANVEQLVLHEIAHALAGPASGHGPDWLSTARAIGYTGGRLGSSPRGVALQAVFDAAMDAELKEVADLGLRQLTRPVTRGLEVWFVARSDLHVGRVYAVRAQRCSVLTPGGDRWFLPNRCLLETCDESLSASTGSRGEATIQQL